MSELLDAREYTLEDQRRFAQLSGDFNPVHVDPATARRELYGEVVVHGVHALLRALDAWLAGRPPGGGAITLSRLKVRFPNPILLGQRVETFLREESDGRAVLQTRYGRLRVLDAEAHWAPAAATPPAPALPARPALTEPPAAGIATPADPDFAELDGRRGSLALHAAAEPTAAAFPRLAEKLPPVAIAELLALTRLVGMECPGLHSIFSGFEVEFAAAAEPDEGGVLAWEVSHVDRRFSLVRITLVGPGLRGKLEAFRRPAPQAQPGIDEVRTRVIPGEFAGQCALVLGGSRGLGEATAKLLAAGGAHAIVTYHRGREDAHRLARAIREAGLACTALAWDVAAPGSGVAELRKANLVPSHLYYFASPKIFVSKPKLFEPALFRSFADVYVDGFLACVDALRETCTRPLRIFYPSSTALDERLETLAEYSAAKAAGEELCAHLDRFDRDLHILVRRLPRIATDQTLSVTPTPAANALDVMLEIARELARDRTQR